MRSEEEEKKAAGFQGERVTSACLRSGHGAQRCPQPDTGQGTQRLLALLGDGSGSLAAGELGRDVTVAAAVTAWQGRAVTRPEPLAG